MILTSDPGSGPDVFDREGRRYTFDGFAFDSDRGSWWLEDGTLGTIWRWHRLLAERGPIYSTQEEVPALASDGSLPATNLPVPSVGRDVHYVSYGTPGGEYRSVCRAAKITVVNGPAVYRSTGEPSDLWDVGLCVMNPTGLFFLESCTQMEHVHNGGTWHWPERVNSPADLNLQPHKEH
jgi:hypothetical protein